MNSEWRERTEKTGGETEYQIPRGIKEWGENDRGETRGIRETEWEKPRESDRGETRGNQGKSIEGKPGKL